MTPDGLQAYSNPLDTALNLLPCPAWMQDLNGMVWYNGAWKLFFGEVPLGAGWLERTSTEDRPRVSDLYQQALQKSQGFGVRVHMQDAKGQWRPCHLSFQQMPGTSRWMGMVLEIEDAGPAADSPVADPSTFQATLHQLRVSLAHSLRQQDVTEAILLRMKEAFGATGCRLLLPEEQGYQVLERGKPCRRLPGPSGQLHQQIQDGPFFFWRPEGLFTETASGTLDAQVLWVPLRVEQQLMGILQLDFLVEPVLTSEQRDALTMHAEYLAIVLRRVRLFEAEKHARTSSEEALKQSQIAQKVTSALVRAETPQEMTQVLLDHTFAPLGIQDTALFLVNPDAQEISLVAWKGMGEQVAKLGKTCPLTAQVPAAHVAHQQQPLFLGSPEDAQHLFPGTMKLPAHTQMAAKAYLPLVLGEEVLGVVFFGFVDPQHFAEGFRLFLQNLAFQVALAVKRVRVHQKELALLQEHDQTIARLNAILENAPMGIAMFDPQLRLQSVNPKLMDYTQLPAAEHEGKTWRELSPGTSEHLMAAQQHVLASGSPVLNIEASRTTVTGQVQTHLISYFPVRTPDGRSLGVGTTVQDITERKQVEEALRASEHFLKHLNDTVPALVYVYSLEESRITYINPGFTQMTGFQLRDLQALNGEELGQMVHPEDQLRIQQELQKLLTLRDGESLTTEYRSRTRDGRWRWLHSTQVVFARHVDGRPALLLGAALDITERKEAEMQLRESERRFQLVADQAPVMVWMGNHDYGSTFFNTSWLSFRGRTLEQELGVGWLEGIHPEDLERCDLAFVQAHQNIQEFEIEYRLLRHDGQYRWVVDRGVPRFTETGEFRGFIGACIDIHDRKLAEEILQDSEQQLRGLMDAQKRFVADAAHELRTPLTAIQGNLDILVRYQNIPEEEKKEIIGDVQREATRLGRLVHDMLQLARGDAGATLREEELDLARLILDTWKERERVHTTHRFVLGPVAQVRLVGDRDRLKQVVLILLENALKYTPEGGEIHLSLEHCGSCVLLKVQDTGMGIASEDLERVFERFYRADKSRHRSTDPGGTGLGLPIARWVVEAHQGHIWLESELDRGTTVHVQLPIRLEDPS